MFYLKLAINNIRKSFSNFAPFLLASTVMYVMNLIIATILFSPSIDNMKSGATVVRTLMGMGLVIISAFAVVILVYGYRFLVKRRTKEFGLYEILGLSKAQIAHISLDELIILFVTTVLAGTLIGLILAKFLFLILVSLIDGSNFGLEFSSQAIIVVSLIFLAIFFLLAIISTITIQKNSSLNLLKEESRGEKEPKANFIFAFLSVILIGIGYYMAVTVKNPMTALTNFFIAVILVIVGTYLFYLSFTIWLLRRQKANKNYYYQPKHFITVSSLLYRMKQNAVGLANITVLVAMTFVTLAITVGLHTGVKDVVNQAFPQDTNTHVGASGVSVNDFDLIVKSTTAAPKLSVQYMEANSTTVIAPDQTDLVVDGSSDNVSITNFASLKFLAREDLVKIGNEDLPEISGNEVILVNAVGKSQLKNIDWYGQKLVVKDIVEDIKNVSNEMSGVNSFYLIFPTEEALNNFVNASNEKNEELGASTGSFSLMLASMQGFTNVSSQDQATFKEEFERNVKAVQQGTGQSNLTMAYKSDLKASMNEFTGSFLFIGFTLGVTFILGAALIIYYKQVSEGAQDKRNFKILQEVGLSKEEVASTIKSQVVMVFFMPIALAITHFAFAFIMIKKLLAIFGVTNGNLILMVSLITILVVAVVYYLIYKLTSKVYYNIVERN
ncbi:FtsX-like permease family protein [Streptococcaceae bacterium ESL0687]|nr:FtsX-like permease family protein [Streptococcaceae bacterium ESL0687]